MLQKADDPLDTRNGVFGDPFDRGDEGSAEDLESQGLQIRRSTKMTPVYRPTVRD